MIKITVADKLIIDGELMEWFVKPGTHVEKGDSLAEIQQEKDSDTIVAPSDGMIDKIQVSEGSSVKYGDVLATFDETQSVKKSVSSPKKQALRTIVIGSGPGGYVAAIRAAELGQEVTVIEDTFIGGVCLNVGCIPSKSLVHAGDLYSQAKKGSDQLGIPKGHLGDIDFKKTQHWKQHDVVERLTSGVQFLMQRHHINIIWGHGVLTDAHHVEVTMNDTKEKKNIEFDNVIVATGSHPMPLPNVPFSKHVVDSTGCLDFEEIPRRLVIIGGGFISAELSDVYAHLGSDVTILEHSGRILKHFDSDMSSIVTKQFLEDGGHVIYNAEIDRVQDGNDEVTVHYTSNGKKHQITADYVLLAVGRRPNTENLGLESLGVKFGHHHLIEVDDQGHTCVPSIWAIGDVVHGKMLAHKASYEGKVAAEAIAGEDVKVAYKAMPAVAFTNPEIASTGLTLADIANNDKYSAYKFDLAYNGRALSLNETNGFIRMIVDNTTQKVVGSQIAGPSASELIGEMTLIIQNGLTAKDVADSVHPHPTISDSIVDCADDALHLPINN